MTTEAPSLILVDDDEPFRQRLGRALGERGFSGTTYASVEEALAALHGAREDAGIELRGGGGAGG
ncbi:MAG: two-component system response regulator, partial [Archangium sp.]|nr:two-component system response regulator [Archangium sp.]